MIKIMIISKKKRKKKKLGKTKLEKTKLGKMKNDYNQSWTVW